MISVSAAGRRRLGQVDSPAILLDHEHRILAANAAYEARYGAPKPGKDRCYRVSHGYRTPCDHNGETCPVRLARATGRAARVQHDHMDLDGGHHHCDITLEPISDPSGRIVEFIEIVSPCEAEPSARLLGRSGAFAEVIRLIEQVAPTELGVLLLGETGTGKERVAQAIHEASRRSTGPFVPVECSALAESLFESELFGHEAGAFTGAGQAREGLVAAASGGTLFLDEIGDVPLHMQVKLLRLLEAGTYRRVGSTEPRRADFRLVSATNRGLAELVAEGRFRADLYYRLSGFVVEIPPLRARRDDLELLARAFLPPGVELSPAAVEVLWRHPWPGNVRELKNAMAQAGLLAGGGPVGPEHLRLLPPPASAAPVAPGPRGELVSLEQVEREYLLWALEHHDGDRASLADKLGVSLRTLYRKLRDSGVDARG